MKSKKGIIVFALFCLSSISAFTQDEVTLIDTASIETNCDCIKALYTVKTAFLGTFDFENGKLASDSISLEKRKVIMAEEKPIHEKCRQMLGTKSDDDCPEGAKYKALDEEYELIRRVLEMQPQRGCN